MRDKISNNASLKDIISMLDKVGWNKGLDFLEKEHKRLEWLQAEMFEQGEIEKANTLGVTLVKQDITLIRLKQLKEKVTK